MFLCVLEKKNSQLSPVLSKNKIKNLEKTGMKGNQDVLRMKEASSGGASGSATASGKQQALAPAGESPSVRQGAAVKQGWTPCPAWHWDKLSLRGDGVRPLQVTSWAS